MSQPPPAPPPPPPGSDGGYAAPQSNTPQILSIIGIVCWFCCAIVSIVLGIIAQNQFRQQGRPDTIARVAWIGGIVSMVLGLIITIATRM